MPPAPEANCTNFDIFPVHYSTMCEQNQISSQNSMLSLSNMEITQPQWENI